MNILTKKKIVLLGMMSKMPVAGNMWLVAMYLVGFQRLGYDVYYVEAHGCTPRELMEHEADDGWAKAAALIDRVLRRFDLGNHWAYHALHADGRCYGMSRAQLNELSTATLADNFCNAWSGGLNFLQHRLQGSEVSIDPAGNVYPCCRKKIGRAHV